MAATPPYLSHPWTNSQVERMNRTIKDATVRRFQREDHGQLRTHRTDFISAYNFAKRLETPGGLTFPMNSSARHGQTSPTDSASTRSITCRD